MEEATDEDDEERKPRQLKPKLQAAPDDGAVLKGPVRSRLPASI